MVMEFRKIGLASIGAIAISASVASAAVVRVSEANFQASAGLITFSEFGVGTTNPTYAPSDYGGGVDNPTVTFDGFFTGQSLSADAAADCPGARATACIVGNPTGPLTLDADSPDTFITTDGSNPTSPVLSGAPRFNGPIAVLFDSDQFGVGFDGGFFDAVASTAITAFGRDGSLLGSVANEQIGIEFLGLVSENEDIAGVFLDLIGAEPAGFAIDNLRFGERSQIIPPSPITPGGVIPLPAGLPLVLTGLGALGGLGALRRRKEKSATI